MLDPLDQLAGIPASRDQLDDTELDLIDRARQAGATWTQVGEALGLGSRQAAEQRRQRLAAARTARRARSDRHWPSEVAVLRGSSPTCAAGSTPTVAGITVFPGPR
ncbi:hypothetical protein GCM10029963_07610 [Micromonospora andamanensis]